VGNAGLSVHVRDPNDNACEATQMRHGTRSAWRSERRRMIAWWWRDWSRVWGEIGRAVYRRGAYKVSDLSTEQTTLDHYARQEAARLVDGTSYREGLVGQLIDHHRYALIPLGAPIEEFDRRLGVMREMVVEAYKRGARSRLG